MALLYAVLAIVDVHYTAPFSEHAVRLQPGAGRRPPSRRARRSGSGARRGRGHPDLQRRPHPAQTPRSPRTSRSWPRHCCSVRRSATAGTTSRPWSTAPRPRSAPATRRPGAGSARNGSGSPATCTTSWPTRWSRSTCRPAWARTCSTATRSRPAEPSRTSRRSAARRSPTCGRRSGCSARMRPRTTAHRSDRRRACASSTSWARACARQGSRSTSTSTRRPPPCRRRSPRPATGSSRRRSPTWSGTRGGSHARVRVTRGADALVIEVDDDGGDEASAAPPGAGQGVRGMRERAQAAGGTLEAGPQAGGGWRVRGDPADGSAVTIRVLVADDQTLVRAGFRALLDSEDDIEVVGEAVDGADAVALARARPGPTSCSWTSGCPGSTAWRPPRASWRTRPCPGRRCWCSPPSSWTSTSSARSGRARRASSSRTSARWRSSTPYASSPTARACSRRPSPAG